MALVIIGAAVVAVFFLKRAHRPTVQTVKIKPVDFGNASLFFDKSGNVTIIPYVADLFGEGKATADVTLLQQPYDPGRLGAAIRSALASCRSGKPSGSAKLMEKLHSHGWKAFSEEKCNLSVYYREGAGIVFNTTVRTSEGAYVFNTRGIEHCLPADVKDEEIGRTSIELLKRCKS